MHANRPLLSALCALVVIAGSVGGAAACSISVGTPGGLRVNQLTDPKTMASNVSGSTPATMTTILPLLSGVVIDVGVPTVSTNAAGYNYATSSTQVAYTAAVLGVLTVKDQPFTSSPTSFPTGVLGAVTVTITMHNKVVNTSGFPAGTYNTKTVVTCHP